jgi:hypothetical protein
VGSAKWAGLSTGLSPQAIQQAAEDLRRFIKPGNGSLSLFRCGSPADVEAIAVGMALSTGADSDPSTFNYVHLLEEELDDLGLQWKHTPEDGRTGLPAADALHHTLWIPLTTVDDLVQRMAERHVREVQAHGPKSIFSTVGKKELCALAQRPDFKPFVERKSSSHWLLTGKRRKSGT